MTQNEALLKHLQEGNKITSREAYNDLGITQLGRCINDLEKDGYVIKRRWKQVPTRHGDGTTKVKEYWLKDAEEQGDMFGKPQPTHAGPYSQ